MLISGQLFKFIGICGLGDVILDEILLKNISMNTKFLIITELILLYQNIKEEDANTLFRFVFETKI